MNDPQIIATTILLAIVVLISVVGRRVVAEMDLRPEQRQRTRVVLRYSLSLAVFLGLMTVWADVVNEAALVASGFAVAIVLFNKDLILNILGWWQKTITGAYRIGDRIRIGDFRGDVLDYGVLSTKLMEVDPKADHGMRTGNVVTMPNMVLLTEPVVNETLILGFEWKEYRFTVPITQRDQAEATLLKAAKDQLSSYRSEVEIALQQMANEYAFHPIAVEPRIFVEQDSAETVVLILRLATPARALRVTHDALTRAFLNPAT